MTRVTPLPGDLAKLTRSVGATVAAASRSNQLLNNVANSAAVRARKELEHGHGDSAASERRLTTTHRPLPQPTPSPTRTIPLMQGFHTTQRSPYAAHDTSTIDMAFLPNLSALAPGADFSQVRVPILPDNATPNRAAGFHAPETPDAPLAPPEIVIMAADPDSVHSVSALTEVEGMGPDGVELSFAHSDGGAARDDGQFAGGMLRDLWKGLVDDVMGGPKAAKPAL